VVRLKKEQKKKVDLRRQGGKDQKNLGETQLHVHRGGKKKRVFPPIEMEQADKKRGSDGPEGDRGYKKELLGNAYEEATP